jgi:hypothetical protein
MTEQSIESTESTESLADLADTIDVDGDPEVTLRQAREALLRDIPPEMCFLRNCVGNEIFRNDGLVRVARDDHGEPALARHTLDTLSELLAQRATFVKHFQRGDRVMAPPIEIVRKVLAAPDVLGVPVVNQVVNAPVFGPDGELVTEPGLLKGARCWYEPTDAMKLAYEVPKNPTPQEVALAWQWIDELFCDFPFPTKADEANAWAMFLQPFVRLMISGSTPLYVIESPTAGTGKTLLAVSALLPAMGHEIAERQAPSSPDEWRKNILSFLLRGKAVFFLDNFPSDQRLDSNALSSALTARTYEDRLLGASRDAAPDVRCQWILSVNRPQLSQEIARRAVRVLIDSGLERPQERDGFRHDPLKEWVRDNRGQLVWSALTLTSAWVAAGRPKGAITIGSFESWCQVMGGILNVAGRGADFLNNREAFWSKHMDEESEEMCGALDHWWNAHRDRPVTAQQVGAVEVPGAGNIPGTLADLLLGDDDMTTPRGRATKVGQRLRELENRALCGYRVEPAGTSKRARLYVLRKS